MITNVHTTPATTQDVASTADIQYALYKKGLLPSRHLVDAGYVDGDLLVQSADKYSIELFGPTRVNSSWQSRTSGMEKKHSEPPPRLNRRMTRKPNTVEKIQFDERVIKFTCLKRAMRIYRI